jgi:hypothetical protein
MPRSKMVQNKLFLRGLSVRAQLENVENRNNIEQMLCDLPVLTCIIFDAMPGEITVAGEKEERRNAIVREKGDYLLEVKSMERSVVSRLVQIVVEPAYEMNDSLKFRHDEEEYSVFIQIMNRVLCNAYADLCVKKISFSFVKMLEMQG